MSKEGAIVRAVAPWQLTDLVDHVNAKKGNNERL